MFPDPGSHGDFALCTHKEVSGDPPVTVPWASRWLMVKNPPVNAGNIGSIPGSGSCPGEGNGNPVQYSCLGNPMVRGVLRATDHRVAQSST